MKAADIHVTIADLPQVQAALAEAAEEIGILRHLLAEWEPRVRCPQCGCRYSERACGPTHAIIWHQVQDRLL